MKTIDMTPTWGEIGNLYARLAESGETKALAGMRSEAARAFAASQALLSIQSDLTDAQRMKVAAIMDEEMAKQGFPTKGAKA